MTETLAPHHPTSVQTGVHADASSAGHKKSWAVLAVTLTAQILVVVDISVVNTALPTIGRSLQLDGGQLQWLVTAYLMMSGGGLLLGGRVADLLSRRRVFLTGLALFTFASLVSGFAGNAAELIAARAVQGLSAALLTPSALSLLMTTYEGEQRKRDSPCGERSAVSGSPSASWSAAPSPPGPAGSSSSGSTDPLGSSPSSSVGASFRRRSPSLPGRSRSSTYPVPSLSSVGSPPSSAASAARLRTAGGLLRR